MKAIETRRLPYLGYALYWAWMLVCFRGIGVFLPEGAPRADVPYDASLPFMCAIVAHAIAHLLWGVALWRRPVLATRIPWGSSLVMGAVPLAAALALGTGEVDAARWTFSLACAVVTGAASALLDVRWSQLFGDEEPSVSGRLVALSAAGGATFYYLLVLIGSVLPFARVGFAAVLPLASAWCIATCVRMKATDASAGKREDLRVDDGAAQRAPDPSGAVGVLWRPVVGSLALFFMYDCMTMLVGSTWSGAYAHGLALLPQVLVALALCLFTRRGERISIGATYGTALVLVCAGFMLLPVAVQVGDPSGMLFVASVFSWAGGSVFDIMVLIMVAHAAYDYRLPGGVVGAFVRSITLGASAIGAVVGWRLSNALWSDSLVMTVFVQAVLLAAIVSAALLLGRRRLAVLLPEGSRFPEVYEALAPNPHTAGRRHAGGAVTGEDPNEIARIAVLIQAGDAPEGAGATNPSAEELAKQAEEYRAKRIAEVARDAGLSRRETDVFALMVTGRSAPFIASQLLISENTVNSHVRRIYNKLDVHSKQGLLDLVEEQMDVCAQQEPIE